MRVKIAEIKFKDWLNYAQIFFQKSASTIVNHFEGICNYFLNCTTSGVMEGINNRIKLIMRQGYGFSNFDNFRERVLACFSNQIKISPQVQASQCRLSLGSYGRLVSLWHSALYCRQKSQVKLTPGRVAQSFGSILVVLGTQGKRILSITRGFSTITRLYCYLLRMVFPPVVLQSILKRYIGFAE